MDELTTRKCLTLLYADHGADLPDAKVKVWAGLFTHIENDTAQAATKWLLLQGSFGLPKASDFAAAVARVERANELPEPLEAWTMALGALREAPAIVQKVCRAFPEDFGTLALSQMPTVRGQFLKLYQSELNRRLENVGASPELKAEVKRIRDNRQRLLSAGEKKTLAEIEPKQKYPNQAHHYDRDAARGFFELTGEWPSWADAFHMQANDLSNNGWQREPEQLGVKA